MTRKRGTCVLVGLPPGEFPIPRFDAVANCITTRGSFVGTRQDMAEALAFAAEGKVKTDIELQPLSSINQIFDRLEPGQVESRVVLDFARGGSEIPALGDGSGSTDFCMAVVTPSADLGMRLGAHSATAWHRPCSQTVGSCDGSARRVPPYSCVLSDGSVSHPSSG